MSAAPTPSDALSFDPLAPEVQAVRETVTNRWKLRAFMGAKLPLALFAGLRVTELTAEACSVTVPYGWRTQNPFRSTYFAAQAMAAEMSTGALGLALVQSSPKPVSMLIVGLTAEFTKKADQTITFRTTDGAAVAEVFRHTLATGEPVTVTCSTVGTLPDGTVASRFTFTWSFKRRSG